jgi:hypothetical protein
MNYISLNPNLTASITLYGYMFDKTSNIFLSGNQNFNLSPLTAVDHFSNSHRVSAICPAFTGVEITTYKVLDQNRLVVYLYNIIGTSYADLIWYNKAGYTKLSDKNYLIKFTQETGLISVDLVAIDGTPLYTINNWSLSAIQPIII